LFPDDVDAFSRSAVMSACPKTKQRAKALLFAVAKAGEFERSLGVELEPETVLSCAFIECLVLSAPLSPPTRRTLGTNLPRGRPCPFPSAIAYAARTRARQGLYSQGERTCFLALADAQPTAARRYRASALICLCAGAGPVPGEFRGLSGRATWRRGTPS
jgi:hypothetical protein